VLLVRLWLQNWLYNFLMRRMLQGVTIPRLPTWKQKKWRAWSTLCLPCITSRQTMSCDVDKDTLAPFSPFPRYALPAYMVKNTSAL